MMALATFSIVFTLLICVGVGGYIIKVNRGYAAAERARAEAEAAERAAQAPSGV